MNIYSEITKIVKSETEKELKVHISGTVALLEFYTGFLFSSMHTDSQMNTKEL